MKIASDKSLFFFGTPYNLRVGVGKKGGVKSYKSLRGRSYLCLALEAL
jgi:hypothetical protein